MQVATQFKSAKLADLDIAASALYLLAELSTPDGAKEVSRFPTLWLRILSERIKKQQQ
jgi:predicted nucleic acid-binding protein